MVSIDNWFQSNRPIQYKIGVILKGLHRAREDNPNADTTPTLNVNNTKYSHIQTKI